MRTRPGGDVNVAVFGGSFNPPHIAHVLAATYALSVGFDKVLAVVVAQHAFAKELASFEHRVAMAERAFAHCAAVEVSTIEASLPSPSYTVQTLRALHQRHPTWRLRLLIGADVLAELDRWNEPEEVRRLAPPFLLGRLGHPHPQTPAAILPEVSATAVRERVAQPAETNQAWLKRYVPADVLEYIAEHALYR